MIFKIKNTQLEAKKENHIQLLADFNEYYLIDDDGNEDNVTHRLKGCSINLHTATANFILDGKHYMDIEIDICFEGEE